MIAIDVYFTYIAFKLKLNELLRFFSIASTLYVISVLCFELASDQKTLYIVFRLLKRYSSIAVYHSVTMITCSILYTLCGGKKIVLIGFAIIFIFPIFPVSFMAYKVDYSTANFTQTKYFYLIWLVCTTGLGVLFAIISGIKFHLHHKQFKGLDCEPTTKTQSKRLLAVGVIFAFVGLLATVHRFNAKDSNFPQKGSKSALFSTFLGMLSGVIGMIVFLAGKDVFFIERWIKRKYFKQKPSHTTSTVENI